VYATAIQRGATLVTRDSDFDGLPSAIVLS
jgi:predicted nucleic acid-binding protein